MKTSVIVRGSAANPPHAGHFHCLETAQKLVEKQLGYRVLFTTMAVAHLGYLRRKLKDAVNPIILSDEARLRMLEIMAKDNGDSTSSSFSCPTKTYGSALEYRRHLRSSEDAAIVLVIGGDRALKWRKAPKPGVVTICRARDPEQVTILQTRDNSKKTKKGD